MLICFRFLLNSFLVQQNKHRAYYLFVILGCDLFLLLLIKNGYYMNQVKSLRMDICFSKIIDNLRMC